MARVIIMARVKIMGSYGILCHDTCFYNDQCNFVMVKLPTGGGLKKNLGFLYGSCRSFIVFDFYLGSPRRQKAQ